MMAWWKERVQDRCVGGHELLLWSCQGKNNINGIPMLRHDTAATATGIGHSASKGNTMHISTQLAFDIIIMLEGAALGGGATHFLVLSTASELGGNLLRGGWGCARGRAA
jgi:hypothetical protein